MKYSKKDCKDSEAFLSRLNSYALAASAAGVSLLAVAQSAEAEIVYTPAHRVIKNKMTLRLDLNHDGVTDLRIRDVPTSYCGSACGPIESLGALLSQPDGVVHNAYGAVAMKAGMKIGPKSVFDGGTQHMVWSTGNYATGSWINVKNRYLGVKFQIEGKIHYGWVRLSVRVRPGFKITATLTGYAYETDVNKPIVAGKTKNDESAIGTHPDSSSRSTAGGVASVATPGPTRRAATLGMLALGARDPEMPLP